MKHYHVLSLIAGLLCFVNSVCQNNAGITSVGSSTACPNTIINVPLYVFHSPIVSSIGLTIGYNPSVLSALYIGNGYASVINLNPSLSGGLYGAAQSNNQWNGAKQVKFGWSSAVEVQLDTNMNGLAKICDIQFRYFGGTTSMTFDNSTASGTNCMYGNSNGHLIDTPTVTYYISGMVTPDSIPVIQGNISGNLFPCQGYTAQYSVVGSSGISYFWSAPASLTGTSTTESITFLVGTFTSDTIFVSPINACSETGTAVSLIVTENSIPVLTGLMAFTDTTPCVSTYQTYSVMNIPGVTYSWSAPSTWIGTSITNSITYQIGAFTYDTVFVSATNSCGTSDSLFLLVHDCALGISGNPNVNNFTVENYPNPCSQSTTIDFNIPEPGMISIDVYNVFGEHLLNVADNYYSEGRYEVGVNMSNFADGIYSCRVKYSLKGKVFDKDFKIIIIK